MTRTDFFLLAWRTYDPGPFALANIATAKWAFFMTISLPTLIFRLAIDRS